MKRPVRKDRRPEEPKETKDKRPQETKETPQTWAALAWELISRPRTWLVVALLIVGATFYLRQHGKDLSDLVPAQPATTIPAPYVQAPSRGGVPAPPVIPLVKIALIGERVVTPELCTFKSPCPAISRGQALHVELTGPGHAIAFLEDKGGFYDQEGRLLINGAAQGDVGLYPGLDDHIDHRDFPLYVVTSADANLTPTPDSLKRAHLPAGEVFGPVYLRFRKRNPHSPQALSRREVDALTVRALPASVPRP